MIGRIVYLIINGVSMRRNHEQKPHVKSKDEPTLELKNEVKIIGRPFPFIFMRIDKDLFILEHLLHGTETFHSDHPKEYANTQHYEHPKRNSIEHKPVSPALPTAITTIKADQKNNVDDENKRVVYHFPVFYVL